MSDDERRDAPRDRRSSKAPRPVRTRDLGGSGRGPVSTERLANLDEALGFEPVDGEGPRASSPPLPRAQGAPALDRRPPAAHRVSSGARRVTNRGLGELAAGGDDPHVDATAVDLPARSDGASDEPTRAGQGGDELPRVLLSSGLVRAGDVLEDAHGAQAEPRRRPALEEPVVSPRGAGDRPPLSERRDVDAALVRPNVRRDGSGSDPGRVQVRGRGLTRRPGRPERPADGPRRPVGPQAPRAAIRKGPEPPRVGVRREPTGPRVGRYAIGEHPDEKTVAAEGAQTGRSQRQAGVRRGPDEPPRKGQVAAVSARLQREPTDPSRAAQPFEPEPSGRPMIAPNARRQREPTDPGGRPLVAPLTRVQREATDPGREPASRRARRAKPPAKAQREPTDPGRSSRLAGSGPVAPAQRESTDPGRSSRLAGSGPVAPAQREPTDPGRGEAPADFTNPELMPSALQREPTDPGSVAAAPTEALQREPTDPGRAPSSLITSDGTDPAGRPMMTPPPSKLAATLERLKAGGPGPGAARAGALQRSDGARPAPPEQRYATVPAGAAGMGSLRDVRRVEATESSASPVQREATVPVGAARAGVLAERLAGGARGLESQREPTTPKGGARKGALRGAVKDAAPDDQREATTPKGAARAGGLREARQSEATATARSARQQEATATGQGPRPTDTGATARSAQQHEATATGQGPRPTDTGATVRSARQHEATATGQGPRPTDTGATARSARPQEATATGRSLRPPTPEPAERPETPGRASAIAAEPALATRKGRLRADAVLGEEPPDATDAAETDAPGPSTQESARRRTAPQGSRGQSEPDGVSPLADAPLRGATGAALPSLEEIPPRLAHHTVTGVLSADERAGLFGAAGRREPGAGFFRSLSIVSMVLLFEAIALPTSAGAPWALLGDPGGVTFVALAFLLLVVVAHILPVRPTLRAAAALGVGVLMAGFSLVVAGTAARADLFDGQPAMAAVMGGPGGARVVLMLALMALPFGLLWRFLEPERLGPRIAHGVGLALVLFVALGAGALGLGEGAAVAGAFDALGSAPIFGDRLVAAFGLMPLLVALVSVAGYLPGGRGRRLVVFAVIYWVALAIPLIVAALFVAKSEDWMAILEPLKVASFVAVPLLYLPAAAATFVATLRRR